MKKIPMSLLKRLLTTHNVINHGIDAGIDVDKHVRYLKGGFDLGKA